MKNRHNRNAGPTQNPGGQWTRDADPHAEREARRYDSPLPSREFIMEALAAEGVPVEEKALARLLGIKRGEAEPFARRLAAMERVGQILRNRKGAILLSGKLDLVAGRVVGHPEGYGFVVPDPQEGRAPSRSDDLFLSPREMQRVMHGDRVMVREAGVDRRGRREGTIVEVIERSHTRIVGRMRREHSLCFVEPADRRIAREIAVADADAQGAKTGEVVVVELLAQPDSHAQPVGRVVEVLGAATDPGMEIEIALRKHDLPFEFSAAAKARTAKLPSAVRKTDLKDREDVRDLELVTIDGETARDFDDAVWAERQGRGFRLVVAIADVSHYVEDGDALDHDARERGNSVYFPRRVIPMLPEKLSNGLCSLNPEVERLCMVCDMTVGATGAIRGYRFYPAVMLSRARLTYNQVWDALRDPAGEAAAQLGPLNERLSVLYDLFKVLLKAREKRGAIDFETIETRIVFDDKGKIATIIPVERNDAHRVIEECMLAANVCASDFLAKARQSTLYRVHEGPTEEKLGNLREFLAEFGLNLSGGDKPAARDYARLLASIKSRPDIQLLQTVLLRSLQQAQYSPENVGHFGLAYESYTHFTSPIRRYPDLLVHRAIKAVLAGGKYTPKGMNWAEIGAQCSMTERRADEATREVEAWLKCYYMRNRVGEEFEGSIAGVANFGIFVALDGLHVEGMVHISELGSDYFQFDAARHQLLGERSGRRYRLADRIRVKIARVDLETSRIDFVLADEARDGTVSAASAYSQSARSRRDDTTVSGRTKAGREPARTSGFVGLRRRSSK